MSSQVSKLVATILVKHSRLRRLYYRKEISDKELDEQLVNLIDALGELTGIYGHCYPITSAKIQVWHTIETCVEEFKDNPNE